MIESILYPALLLLPSLIFPVLLISYRVSLSRKSLAFSNIFSNSAELIQSLSHLTRYKKSEKDSTKKGKLSQPDYFAKLFDDIYFSRLSYIFPIVILMIIVVIGTYAILTKTGINCYFPDEFITKIRSLEIPVLLGFTGAYVWGLNDILIRNRNLDLTPNSLHFIWLRMIIASVVGFIISEFNFPLSIEYTIAFAIGAFPVKSLKMFLEGVAEKYLNKISKTKLKSEDNQHDFKYLEGLHSIQIRRLQEENINNNQNLAFQDPIPLYLRTNIEWKVLLDIIDQAFLSCYLEDKIAAFRKFGIRGAIEAASLYQDYTNEPSEILNDVVKSLSAVLEISENCTVQLLKQFYDDLHVKYLWTLWEFTTYHDEAKLKAGTSNGENN